MLFFIKILISFSALITVKCDINVPVVFGRLLGEYMNLTEAQARHRVDSNMRAFCAIMRAGEIGLTSQGMKFMAQLNEKRVKLIEKGWSMAYPYLDNVTDIGQRIRDTMFLGVGSGLATEGLEDIASQSANEVVVPTDSVSKLNQRYKQGRDKMLELLQFVIKKETQEPGWDFWLRFHQYTHDYFVEYFKSFENELKKVKNIEIKRKMLQIVLNDMKFTFAVTDFKHAPKPEPQQP